LSKEQQQHPLLRQLLHKLAQYAHAQPVMSSILALQEDHQQAQELQIQEQQMVLLHQLVLEMLNLLVDLLQEQE